jgi:salicylate hydroxylase/6-hydroxynicotinate 3-monooxygenase
MAQGAATSIEDAAILARCLSEFTDIRISLEKYEAHRKPRTSRIQAISSANTWMKTQESNPDWLYGYDAWSVPLGDSGTAHA